MLFQILKNQPIRSQNPSNNLKWLLFILLCVIWGSSFVLMKLGMFAPDGSAVLSAWQVAAIRIFTSGLVLVPFAVKAWKRVTPSLRGIILVSGWLGSFIPAILFCLAESRIDSALAGTLNAVTPLSTLLIGWLIYRVPVAKSKLWGILIGLAGCILLFMQKAFDSVHHPGWAGLVLVATLCYGWNVHLVKQKLSGISAMDIATLAFSGMIPFSLLLLVVSGYFSLPIQEPIYAKATLAASILGIIGTAVASVIFYRIVKISGALFASLVTYGIPFVAIGWGLVYGEKINLTQVAALAIILGGVYLTNKER
jgi:drug/metabolite transporter (DMT)-like permease